MAQPKWKHRIRLILDEGDSSKTVAFYTESLEQAGILTYLARRCLVHPSFQIMHDIYNRSVGFNTVGEPYEVKKSHQDFAELKESRENKGNFRVRVHGMKDMSGENVPEFVFYMVTQLDADIFVALISNNLQDVNTVVTIESRDRKTNLWVHRDIKSIVP